MVYLQPLSCFRIAVAVLCAVLALSSCKEERADPLYEELAKQYNAQPVSEDLGPGDKVSIKVLHEDSLSGEFTVSPAGTISYPYVGRINVRGKTCLNLEDTIAEGLKKGYLSEPSVSCSILEYNSKQFFIFGEVKSPGAFPYKSNATIVEAIALAGGFSVRAMGNRTRLTRQMDDANLQIEVPVQDIIEGKTSDFTILPGDVIFVPKNPW